MIVITRAENSITISGHANYAPKGQDIVCAAVSALSYTLEESLKRLTDDKIECLRQPGLMSIKYEGLSERGQLLIRSFFIGVQMIAEEYPDYVRIV